MRFASGSRPSPNELVTALAEPATMQLLAPSICSGGRWSSVVQK
jgi:hypothetical protein